jgi:hypothetical protein
LAYSEWREEMDEHTRNERMGKFREVLTNSTLFSDTMFATQHPIATKRHTYLMTSAPKGKNERKKK